MTAEMVETSFETPEVVQPAPESPGTLGDLFRRAAEKYDLANAFNYKAEGEWNAISSREFVQRSENVGLGLYLLGLRYGDRAAILAANSPEWTIADAGCQLVGIVDVPIYTTLAPEAVAYIINDSQARAIFLQDQETYERIRLSIEKCSSLERLIFFDMGAVSDPRAVSLSELEQSGSELSWKAPELLQNLGASVKPEDVATLIYTSGTTGEPKGVMLSHSNLISNAIDASSRYAFSPNDVSLSVLPLSHVFERTGMYVYILCGMAVYYAESIEKVPDNLKEVRPTIFIGVPRIFEKVYEKARLTASRSSPMRERIFDWAMDIAKEYARCTERGSSIPVTLSAQHGIADQIVYSQLRAFFGGNLRFCITGGAALSDDIYLIFTGAGISIMQGYGLTETSPVISSNNPSAVRVGTVGRPIPNVGVRIAGDGEIEVAGPGVMIGYYNKPNETEGVFCDDGWLKTGDVGHLDEDGFLTISDRKKELFKTSGGKYIAPAHIEQMLQSSRFVNQAVLVGNDRKYATALIVPNFDMLESYAHLKALDLKTPKDFCHDQRINDLFRRQIEHFTSGLSQWETVKKFTLIENEFTVDGGELTPTMKIKRRVIDQKFNAVIDAMYS